MTRLDKAASRAEALYDESFVPYRSLVEADKHLAMGYIYLQTLQMSPAEGRACRTAFSTAC